MFQMASVALVQSDGDREVIEIPGQMVLWRAYDIDLIYPEREVHIMELLQRKCPSCTSFDIRSHTPYTTKNHGVRVMYQCESCLSYFSETKNTFMEGLKTPMSVIWLVIKARTDGMGLNAATRTFDVAKNTMLSWERKFSDLHRVLFLYTMVHEFIA